jgi:hypothetical protein
MNRLQESFQQRYDLSFQIEGPVFLTHSLHYEI